MNIFSSLHHQLPEFKEYLRYYKEETEGKFIRSMKLTDHVLARVKEMAEQFCPSKECNHEGEQF